MAEFRIAPYGPHVCRSRERESHEGAITSLLRSKAIAQTVRGSLRTAALAGAVPALALVFSACTTTTDAPTRESIPAVVDFTSAARRGTPVVVRMPVNGFLTVSGTGLYDMDPGHWTATITDPTVLEFSPAEMDGPAASLPLLVGLSPGETTAVVTYSGGTTTEVVTYEVTVEGR